MKTRLVIFGNQDFARLAKAYFDYDSNYDVVGFTVDSDFLQGDMFEGLPVVPFDTVQTHFSPEDHEFFVATGYKELNALRAKKCRDATSKGYKLASYISPKAQIMTSEPVGPNAFICEGVTVHPWASIGDGVVILTGTLVGHHASVGDYCFVSGNVILAGYSGVGEHCFLGANSTIRNHCRVESECILGAGVILLEDAEAGGVYRGAGAKRANRSSHNQLI